MTHSSSCIFGFPEIWGTPLRISGLFVTQPIASANLVSVIMEVGIGNHRLIAALVNLHARNSRMTWKNCEKSWLNKCTFAFFWPFLKWHWGIDKCLHLSHCYAHKILVLVQAEQNMCAWTWNCFRNILWPNVIDLLLKCLFKTSRYFVRQNSDRKSVKS